MRCLLSFHIFSFSPVKRRKRGGEGREEGRISYEREELGKGKIVLAIVSR